MSDDVTDDPFDEDAIEAAKTIHWLLHHYRQDQWSLETVLKICAAAPDQDCTIAGRRECTVFHAVGHIAQNVIEEALWITQEEHLGPSSQLPVESLAQHWLEIKEVVKPLLVSSDVMESLNHQHYRHMAFALKKDPSLTLKDFSPQFSVITSLMQLAELACSVNSQSNFERDVQTQNGSGHRADFQNSPPDDVRKMWKHIENGLKPVEASLKVKKNIEGAANSLRRKERRFTMQRPVRVRVAFGGAVEKPPID